MHQSVANSGVPLGWIVIVDSSKYCAEPAINFSQVRVGHIHKNASVEEKHEDDAICNPGHYLRVSIVANPRD